MIFHKSPLLLQMIFDDISIGNSLYLNTITNMHGYIFSFFNILLSDEHPAKILIIYTKHATMKINEKFLSSTQAGERQE